MNKFKINSSMIRVTDPCYDREVPENCYLILEKVMNGTWVPEIERHQCRVSRLTIRHEEVAVPNCDEFVGLASVDSGQCGFYDQIQYPTSSEEFEYDPYTFYGKLCQLTGSDDISVMEHGVFTSSGYGDGEYPVLVQRNSDGVIVAVTIDYTGPEDDFDDEDGDYYEDYEDEFEWDEP